jgi:hypothetical protein
MFFDRLWIDEGTCELFLDAIAHSLRYWADSKGMFKETPRHDWTSHAADIQRYAAIDENQIRNQVFTTPPTTGLVPPYYPQLGV